MEDGKQARLERLAATCLCQFVFYCLLTWQAIVNVDASQREDTSVAKELTITWAVIGAIIWILLQWIIFKKLEIVTEKESWIRKINLSNVAFILACFVPYGVTLHYSHLNANDSLKGHSAAAARQRTGCVTLEETGNTAAFHSLLWTFPMMIITNMLYPYPDEKITSTLITGFQMLDIIDMSELMFGDVGCFQNYGAAAITFFYMALLVSAFLTTSYSGLEQQKENKEDYKSADRVTTFLNLIFNDIMFLCLRVTTMAKEGEAYFGVIFVGKELLSCIIRLSLLYVKQ